MEQAKVGRTFLQALSRTKKKQYRADAYDMICNIETAAQDRAYDSEIE